MNDVLAALFRSRSPATILRDVIDVAIVAYAVYRLLLLLRGTRAMQVGVGLALVVAVYLGAQRLGLSTTYTVLDKILASFLLLVVVVFQADIRRALMRVGNRSFLTRWRKDEETDAVEEVISAAVMLAHRRIGALMVFEREASLDDFASQGTVLDAEVTRELLYTTFLPGYENPLHDGAVIIKNARIWKGGAFLPLTTNPTLDRTLGTRHRAAIGITEETDAVVVVVSEERGQVSLCFNANMVRGLDANSLRQALYGLFYTKRKAAALLKSAHRRERDGDAERPSISGGFRASVVPPEAKQPVERPRSTTRPTDPNTGERRAPSQPSVRPPRADPDTGETSTRRSSNPGK